MKNYTLLYLFSFVLLLFVVNGATVRRCKETVRVRPWQVTQHSTLECVYSSTVRRILPYYYYYDYDDTFIQ